MVNINYSTDIESYENKQHEALFSYKYKLALRERINCKVLNLLSLRKFQRTSCCTDDFDKSDLSWFEAIG
jgi:hypothetical protein